MQPIAQSIETADAFSELQPEVDVLGHLQAMADRVQQVVPAVIGMSIAWLDHGVAFTLVATDEEIAALDAVQYLVGGPCVTSVEREESLRAVGTDLLDEDSWHLFAHTLAATSVHSTLTLLLTKGGATVGSVNLYAATDDAFDGRHGRLAEILGADVSTVIRNADLSFSTRAAAERAPAALRSQDAVDTASGILAAALRIDISEALQRLKNAARRAGITPGRFAFALIGLYD